MSIKFLANLQKKKKKINKEIGKRSNKIREGGRREARKKGSEGEREKIREIGTIYEGEEREKELSRKR